MAKLSEILDMIGHSLESSPDGRRIRLSIDIDKVIYNEEEPFHHQRIDYQVLNFCKSDGQEFQ